MTRDKPVYWDVTDDSSNLILYEVFYHFDCFPKRVDTKTLVFCKSNAQARNIVSKKFDDAIIDYAKKAYALRK